MLQHRRVLTQSLSIVLRRASTMLVLVGAVAYLAGCTTSGGSDTSGGNTTNGGNAGGNSSSATVNRDDCPLYWTINGVREPAVTTQTTRIFPVGANTSPVLNIDNVVGSARVHAGDATNVTINTTICYRKSASPPTVTYDQQGGTVSAKTQEPRQNPQSNRRYNTSEYAVVFNVTVPRNTDLQLKTDAGSIEVNDVTGQMSLNASAGSVSAKQVTLKGTSKLNAESGAIEFDGAITPSGTYNFEAGAGTITAALPASSSFSLNASTGTGVITSNFPGVRVSGPGDSGNVGDPSSRAEGEVGNPPRASVTLKAGTGAIELKKR